MFILALGKSREMPGGSGTRWIGRLLRITVQAGGKYMIGQEFPGRQQMIGMWRLELSRKSDVRLELSIFALRRTSEGRSQRAAGARK